MAPKGCARRRKHARHVGHLVSADAVILRCGGGRPASSEQPREDRTSGLGWSGDGSWSAVRIAAWLGASWRGTACGLQGYPKISGTEAPRLRGRAPYRMEPRRAAPGAGPGAQGAKTAKTPPISILHTCTCPLHLLGTIQSNTGLFVSSSRRANVPGVVISS